MKNLGNLSPAKGSNKSIKRIGRGIGSGLGKTSGKGHKGQKARKGGGIAPGFEGGQTPLYRRLPKRGFTNIFRVEYTTVDLGDLNRFDNDATVTIDTLKEVGLIKSTRTKIKILGNGSLDKKLSVKVQKATKSAKEAITKAGGSFEESK